ncbi:hypothetical protein [Rugosimonospora africana]|uniref:Uncharacterized protein n=1 Tax=Rugosimonospora africana TaxID=556532 RepID=A0A8J3QPB7_9ACTN|nr:hypothetical protein [Rugosimonospora africana]GIH12998.1 hypothetical protein Raf01_11700 [Rugosimonospora africana]
MMSAPTLLRAVARGVRSRAIATLTAIAAVLIGAFVVGPPALAARGPGGGFADEHHLTEAVRRAFVEYWRSGDRDFSPDLDRVVDYWFRFHVAKGVIAGILLIVLIALGALLWRAFVNAGGIGAARQVLLASAGVLVTMLALLSLAAVMANIQGAVAPFTSLMPMLTGGATDGPLADTLAQVRQQLSDSRSAGGRTPPAVGVMINDFTRYHVVMAVLAAMVVVVLIGTSVALWWRRFVRTTSSDRRTRRVWGSFGAFSVLLVLVVIVVGVANATTAADPAPALLALFNGGW